VDNGCSIHAEDLPLAFASHATSKLHSVDDLCRIDTLGYRGEALASIGSTAQVSLQSRPAEQPNGAAITCKGGQLSAVVPGNGSPGTCVEVRHLFYNTPARRKFLKSMSTEMGHVIVATLLSSPGGVGAEEAPRFATSRRRRGVRRPFRRRWPRCPNASGSTSPPDKGGGPAVIIDHAYCWPS
jgi:hypothetical protein